MTEASRQAFAVLRHADNFSWYVIPIFVIVVYIYAVEIEKKNWSLVLAGLAFWGMDWFNEIWNGLILHFTGRSALWTAPAKSAYVILVGLNIEISLMFAILGIVLIKMLPKDKHSRVLLIPNRWFFAVLNSFLCVGIEVILNKANALVWEYKFWNWPNIWLIAIFGYLTFMVVSFWVYDMEKINSKLAVVALIFAVDIFAFIQFALILRWI